MLAAGCSRGVALGGARRGAPAAKRVLLVVCSGSRGGQDPSHLTPSQLPSGGGSGGGRAFTVLSGARQFEWKAVGKQLGGTLIVDDASHKEDVQKVGAAAGEAPVQCALPAPHRASLPPHMLPGRKAASAVSPVARGAAGPARWKPELWLLSRRLPVPLLHRRRGRTDRRRRAHRCWGCRRPGPTKEGWPSTSRRLGWPDGLCRCSAPHFLSNLSSLHCACRPRRGGRRVGCFCAVVFGLHIQYVPSLHCACRPRQGGRRVCGVAAGRLPEERHAAR